jgi:two-component system, cell cycle sensor histidine kinase and response regulator CckA
MAGMKRPVRVLIVEDSEDDALALVYELERGGYAPEWRRVDSRDEMRNTLSAETWQLIISDCRLSRFCADDAIALVRERRLDVPIIIVSSSNEPGGAIDTMRAGASDYILKSDIVRLLPAVERELRESGLRGKAREVEEQLRQAQKMEAVGRLAGGLAHDFNNILTAILGNCELMGLALGDASPLARDVEEIMSSGLRAAALTRQLLSFSRKAILQPRFLEVNDFVANMEKFLRRLIREDVELIIRPGQGVGPIMADAGQMEQIVMNLVVNACDAMPDGGTLTIATRRADYDPSQAVDGFDLVQGPCALLEVSDNGSGIAPEVKARLFEPFFTTKAPGRGTGLGLWTVHGIVKQNSGAIAVESEPGRGTTFRIFLPLAKGTARAAAPAPAPPGSFRGSETLLLVEDDNALRGTVARMLTGFGYQVLAAPGGGAGVREAAHHPGAIDLLVTDVIMPGMDGAAVARKIQEARPDLKVLFLSGYADSVIAPKGVLDPEVNFLAKPFTMAALGQKVREVLDRSRRRVAGA